MIAVKSPRYPISNHLTYESLTPQYKSYLNGITAAVDPIMFSCAVKDAKWCTAMNLELRAVEENGTWIITRLPPEKKAIGWQWIYRTKYKFDDTVEKYKARLVALGYRQQHDVDHEETFSPVAKITTMRALLAVAAIK